MFPKSYDNIIDSDTAKMLGARLEGIMNKKGIDQTKMGELVHKEQATISKIIRAKRVKNNLHDYYVIASALGITDTEFNKMFFEIEKARVGINERLPDDIAYATLSRIHGIDQDDIKKAIDLYKQYRK